MPPLSLHLHSTNFMSGIFLSALNTLIHLILKQPYEIETIFNPIL